MSNHYKMLHNEHYKSAGDPWPENNYVDVKHTVSHREIPGTTPFCRC
jgi:hypothetical protein